MAVEEAFLATSRTRTPRGVDEVDEELVKQAIKCPSSLTSEPTSNETRPARREDSVEEEDTGDRTPTPSHPTDKDRSLKTEVQRTSKKM